MVRYRLKFGRATFNAVRAMLEPRRDDVGLNGEDGAIARATMTFLDGMQEFRGTNGGGLAKLTLTPEEVALLVEEFAHLGSTPALLPEFETNRRNESVRYAFGNIARQLQEVQ